MIREAELCAVAERKWDEQYEGIRPSRRPKTIEFTYQYVPYVATLKRFSSRAFNVDSLTFVVVRTRTGRPVAAGWE